LDRNEPTQYQFHNLDNIFHASQLAAGPTGNLAAAASLENSPDWYEAQKTEAERLETDSDASEADNEWHYLGSN
jgi:hypothetical protein